MQKSLNWKAYSSGNRNSIISEVKDLILKSDGSIINFNMFSDLALSLSIEIEENRIDNLYKSLSSIFTITGFESEGFSMKSKKEWLVFLNISFSKGKGNLKKEIPAVPG